MTLRRMAVIFDMDGVLVDTYRAHFQSWNIVAGEEGAAMSEEQFAATFGRTSREIIALLWPELGDDAAAIQRFDDRKEDAFRRIIAENFPAMPGVERLLEGLAAAGIPTAIGSSGPPANVALVAERLGAKHPFSAVVTAGDVTRGKPDPEVFLLAAECLGLCRSGASWSKMRRRGSQPRGPQGCGAWGWPARGGLGKSFQMPTWWSIRSTNSAPRCFAVFWNGPVEAARWRRREWPNSSGRSLGLRGDASELVEDFLFRGLQQRRKWRTVQGVALAAVGREACERLVRFFQLVLTVAFHARLRDPRQPDREPIAARLCLVALGATVRFVAHCVELVDRPIGGAVVLHFIQGHAKQNASLADFQAVHARAQVEMPDTHRRGVVGVPVFRLGVDFQGRIAAAIDHIEVSRHQHGPVGRGDDHRR